MVDLPAISVSRVNTDKNFPPAPVGISSASLRSPSVSPSSRSNKSRITLVGYDADLESKSDVTEITRVNIKAYSWFDHLLGVFCIHRESSAKKCRSGKEPELEAPEDSVNSPSPWVLPVYVLSARKDKHQHLIPREAQCTIDTGNLQGNIVSQRFVLEDLEYSKANFQALTSEEENGGMGITGHKLIPNGAIYLTWYHHNSGKVFRDMRFLISDHPMYDLVIGARSIQKNHILEVPNFMADRIGGRTDAKKGPMSTAPRLEELETAMLTSKGHWEELETKAFEENDETSKTKEELAEREKRFQKANEAYENELEKVYQSAISSPRTKDKEIQRLRGLFKEKTGRNLPPKGGKLE